MLALLLSEQTCIYLRLSIPDESQTVGFLIPLSTHSVGLPGIEPGLRAPHARVLPIYYSPNFALKTSTQSRVRIPNSPPIEKESSWGPFLRCAAARTPDDGVALLLPVLPASFTDAAAIAPDETVRPHIVRGIRQIGVNQPAISQAAAVDHLKSGLQLLWCKRSDLSSKATKPITRVPCHRELLLSRGRCPQKKP